MWKDDLFRLFGDRNIKFSELTDLHQLNSMRIHGQALVFAEPSDISELVYILQAAKSNSVPFRVIGSMTNTLVCDGVFRGILIKTERIDSVRFTKNMEVYASCGALLGTIVRGSAERGIGGFAEFVGIPGTVGGALYGNAGAHGRDISDLVEEVIVYDIFEEKQKTLTRYDIGYAYRDSLFKRCSRYVILNTKLRGFLQNSIELREQMKQYAAIRRQRQPLSMPSLGSIFKHPTGYFAPQLIESLGLKGFRIGDAEISQLHAGFIVNRGNAKAADVINLIEEIKKRVDLAYGINLEEEINYLE